MPHSSRCRSALATLLAALSLAACAADDGSSGRTTADARAHAGAPMPPPGVQIPDGMVYVPGGRTLIGSDSGEPHERPVFEADVSAFFLDVHPVTVAQFRAFVDEQKYATQAEQFGNAAVFEVRAAQWRLVNGASWRYPLGPDHSPAEPDHPVTQVSWHDAMAYAAWAGRRLPSEVEWEHAARGGVNSRSRYAWGDELVERRHRANTWQGPFSTDSSVEDGYLFTSPVGSFHRTPLGLTDMGGNVWEWVSDWYRPYAERGLSPPPGENGEKVQRGGSFLCHASYCHGFRVSARGHSTPESSHFHVGFRTAMDIR